MDWQSCAKAADKAMAVNPQIHLWTWWMVGTGGHGACWLSRGLYAGTGGPEQGHVMGYKGPAPDEPHVQGGSFNSCDGDCDCGDGLPCGEYLWDHRNGTMLREFLVNEFVLNKDTGLGNINISGFYFDDGWTDKPSPVPSWAPPTYKQCNMWKTGGATEENYYCIDDTGLTQADTTKMTAEHATTMTAVFDAVVAHGGFAWPLLTSRSASLDLADPRPKCASYLRSQCKPSAMANKTLMFEFTKKQFHDSFPLPYVHLQSAVACGLWVNQALACIYRCVSLW